MRRGVETAGKDVALEPDQVTTTHVPISCRMVLPLTVSQTTFLLSLSNDRGFTTITSTMVLFGKTTLRMALSWLVPIGALALSMGRVVRIPLYLAQTRLVEPPDCHLARSPGIVHTCVRVPRVYTVREAQPAIRRAHYSRRDVWSAISFGTCWQLVVMYRIVFGQCLHLEHSRVMGRRAMQSLYRKAKKSGGMHCFPPRTKYCSLQICCAGGPAC